MRFQAQQNIGNLNIRREKAGDGPGMIAADLKIHGKVHLEQLKDLFQAEHGFAMVEGLYDGDGNMRSHDFKSFPLTREIIGAKGRLSTDLLETPLEFDLVDFNSIVLEPEIGRTVLISARLQLHPTEEQVASLAELLMKDVNVVIEHVQAELPLSPQSDGDDAAPGRGAD